ncbi:HAD family hydrolase [Marinobacter nanhaiticus D15-8W]|uniref:HAD family hydrolase n=1 Tax=Marinobacter nanhaiticus D15-8W TaxID=626887 RepID=N6W6D9_9GAMM|nr:HAD family hydrolase [Marinobacter nanhaiticus]ENO15794.1 HAD family hydrolase [Marinobacter nanhaiticus D15-8W]BES73348.1 HAD family hydrolase [Marinobacter nanhaiticus D15-8W]
MSVNAAAPGPEVYLFDWGDTLMVDYPDAPGKMCDWPRVEAVSGAVETLRCLSRHARIYVATGAQDSTESDIWKALVRVVLDPWIAGVFCQANLGVAKGDPRFLQLILQKLSVAPNQTVMVGDNLSRDVMPALASGITPIWLRTGSSDASIESPLNNARGDKLPAGIRVIRNLSELL